MAKGRYNLSIDQNVYTRAQKLMEHTPFTMSSFVEYALLQFIEGMEEPLRRIQEGDIQGANLAVNAMLTRGLLEAAQDLDVIHTKMKEGKPEKVET